MTFQAWKIPFLNSMTFHNFPGCMGTLSPAVNRSSLNGTQFYQLWLHRVIFRPHSLQFGIHVLCQQTTNICNNQLLNKNFDLPCCFCQSQRASMSVGVHLAVWDLSVHREHSECIPCYTRDVTRLDLSVQQRSAADIHAAWTESKYSPRSCPLRILSLQHLDKVIQRKIHWWHSSITNAEISTFKN